MTTKGFDTGSVIIGTKKDKKILGAVSKHAPNDFPTIEKLREEHPVIDSHNKFTLVKFRDKNRLYIIGHIGTRI